MTVEWPSLPPPLGVPAAPNPAPAPPARSEFRDLLDGFARRLDRGEALVERATLGGAARLGASELIALQAGIYRYTEAVELTAKFVDRAQNALRTTLESGGR